MKTTIASCEEFGRTISYAINVEVDDGKEIHIVPVTVIENYDNNSNSHNYEAETDDDWETIKPDNKELVEKIEAAAKKAAIDYV